MPRLLLLLLLITTVSCTSNSSASDNTAIVSINSYEFEVELPKTQEEFRQGLMFRESLAADRGMLFVFPDSAQRSFWMKNTLIPLDIIFIDEKFVIRKIHQAAPCAAEPCPTYQSGVPVKYVLEINGNLTKHYGIAEGDKIRLLNS
ncbi:DUF192 domain-containing protein [Candidatus Woesearchaeota archaeon]|nr:DUF192 domain-containing protein [Candidatus Woesearchaeota archaeon]